MSNQRPTEDQITGLHFYSDKSLAMVATLAEVALMWGYSKAYVRTLIIEGKIDGRKSITGGSYLVSLTSMIRYKGQPDYPLLWSLKTDKGTNNE